jgi:hypothetical protein
MKRNKTLGSDLNRSRATAAVGGWGKDSPSGATRGLGRVNTFHRLRKESKQRAEVADITKQLGQLDIANFLINPEKEARLQYWDFAILVALLYTAIVTPYEVSFVQGTYEELIVLFWFNRIIDALFVVDMFLQFFLMYRAPKSKGSIMVKSHKRVILHYLQGWFVIDVASILPFDSMFAGTGGNLKMIRMVRLLRLLKLMRIIRASRILARWESEMSLQHSTVKLFKIMIQILVVVHWMACIWGMLAGLNDMSSTTWASSWVELGVERGTLKGGSDCLYREKIGEEFPPDAAKNRNGAMWQDCYYDHELYLAALHWSIMTLTSIGYGDILPCNSLEYGFCCALMLFMGLMWAYIISNLCAIAQLADPVQQHYHKQSDEMNKFISSNNIGSQIASRSRMYLMHQKQLMTDLQFKGIINVLSPKLQLECAEMTMKTNRIDMLKKSRYIGNAPSLIKFQIFLMLESSIFTPQEFVPNDSTTLFVLKKGVCTRHGRVFSTSKNLDEAPETWGDDFLLTNPILKQKQPVFCLTFVDLFQLRFEVLEECLKKLSSHPEAGKFRIAMRKALIHLAVMRAVRILGTYQHVHAPTRRRKSLAMGLAASLQDESVTDAWAKGILRGLPSSANTTPGLQAAISVEQAKGSNERKQQQAEIAAEEFHNELQRQSMHGSSSDDRSRMVAMERAISQLDDKVTSLVDAMGPVSQLVASFRDNQGGGLPGAVVEA